MGLLGPIATRCLLISQRHVIHYTEWRSYFKSVIRNLSKEILRVHQWTTASDRTRTGKTCDTRLYTIIPVLTAMQYWRIHCILLELVQQRRVHLGRNSIQTWQPWFWCWSAARAASTWDRRSPQPLAARIGGEKIPTSAATPGLWFCNPAHNRQHCEFWPDAEARVWLVWPLAREHFELLDLGRWWKLDYARWALRAPQECVGEEWKTHSKLCSAGVGGQTQWLLLRTNLWRALDRCWHR